MVHTLHFCDSAGRNHQPISPSEQQRFTFAHQLGHYLLDSTKAQVFIDSATMFFRDGLATEGTDKFEY
jgi:Zn-dependent peptidase ImmA (M78 family)